MSVFGVEILATSGVPDAKLTHAATIMAEYLDNDEDGVVDDATVTAKLVEAKAILVMFKDEAEKESIEVEPEDYALQDLQAEETLPEGSSLASGFDATLEEVLHLISSQGYAKAYPAALGESTGSLLCDAMDIARGGQFTSVPLSYPSGAWYHYEDGTCDYACMATEYFYWALTSHLGAQSYRRDDGILASEWELATPELFKNGDTKMYALLTDAQYKLPSTLPNGSYSPSSWTALAQSSSNLGSKWHRLSWFGDWMETGSKWIYHQEHGWLYLSAASVASIWMYELNLGWLWTTSSIYPFVYSQNKTGWLYFIKSSSPRKFWDFQGNAWITYSN
ncbi:MAG: hypothetical protein VCA36_04665 [Opitutales bacterium]